VRQLFFEAFVERVTDTDGRLLDWEGFLTPLGFETESGHSLAAGWAPRFERSDASLEIRDGIVIPAGDYRCDRGFVFAETAERRRVVASLELGWGGFYDGSRTRIEAELTLTCRGPVRRRATARGDGAFRTHWLVTAACSLTRMGAAT
jgi:hypothetical protein